MPSSVAVPARPVDRKPSAVTVFYLSTHLDRCLSSAVPSKPKRPRILAALQLNANALLLLWLLLMVPSVL